MKTKVLLLLCGIAACATGLHAGPEIYPALGAGPGRMARRRRLPASRLIDACSAPPDLNWREFFADEKLQQVIGMALTNNRDLRLAALNVELARSLYRIHRNELLPAVDAAGSAGKQSSSADLTQPGQPRTTERYDVSLGVACLGARFLRPHPQPERPRAAGIPGHGAGPPRARRLYWCRQWPTPIWPWPPTGRTWPWRKRHFQTQTRRLRAGRSGGMRSASPTNWSCARPRSPVESARRDIAHYTQLVAQDQNALNLLAGAAGARRELLPAGAGPRPARPGRFPPDCAPRCSCAGRMCFKPRTCSRRPTPTSARRGPLFSRAFP